MEVYLKKEKKMEVSIIKEGRKKTEIYIKKMEVYINKKRWMKDKRWIKDGNRPSGLTNKSISPDTDHQ